MDIVGLIEKFGFDEVVNNRFFRKGKKNEWKNELTPEMIQLIEKNFQN